MKDAKEMRKKGEVWGTSDATGKKKKKSMQIEFQVQITLIGVMSMLLNNSYKTTHTIITHFLSSVRKQRSCSSVHQQQPIKASAFAVNANRNCS